MARATLEGVAFQVADLIEAIQQDLDSPLTELRVDGGMARSDPFLQFQADVLGQPIRRSPQSESTALGAALLAGLGVGMWPDRAAAQELLQSGGRTFQPGAKSLGEPLPWGAGARLSRRSLGIIEAGADLPEAAPELAASSHPKQILRIALSESHDYDRLKVAGRRSPLHIMASLKQMKRSPAERRTPVALAGPFCEPVSLEPVEIECLGTIGGSGTS